MAILGILPSFSWRRIVTVPVILPHWQTLNACTIYLTMALSISLLYSLSSSMSISVSCSVLRFVKDNPATYNGIGFIDLLAGFGDHTTKFENNILVR